MSQSGPVKPGGQEQTMMPVGLNVQPADGAQAAQTSSKKVRSFNQPEWISRVM
jgi:hypothetical protein